MIRTPQDIGPAHAVGEVPDAVHGREPVVLQALEPVDRRAGQGQARPAECQSPRSSGSCGSTSVAVRVLGEGGLAEARGDPDPEREETQRSRIVKSGRLRKRALFSVEEVVLTVLPPVIWCAGFIQGQTRSRCPNQEPAIEGQEEEERQPLERGQPVLVLPAQDRRPRCIEDVVDAGSSSASRSPSAVQKPIRRARLSRRCARRRQRSPAP